MTVVAMAKVCAFVRLFTQNSESDTATGELFRVLLCGMLAESV